MNPPKNKQRKQKAAMAQQQKKKNSPSAPAQKRDRIGIPIAYSNPNRPSSRKMIYQTKDSAQFTIRQPFSTIANQPALSGGANAACFVNNTLSTTVGGDGVIPLMPQTINGIVQNEAQFFAEFRIDSITFYYVQSCPTTTTGALAFCCVDQPATTAFNDITSFALARSVTNCVTTSVSTPLSWSFRLNSADREFRIVDGAITGGLSDKLLYNKALIGKMDQPNVAVTPFIYGYLDIEMTFTLRQAVPNQGVALYVNSREEKLVMRTIYEKLFPKLVAIPVPEVEIDVIGMIADRFHLGEPRSGPSSVKSWVSGGR